MGQEGRGYIQPPNISRKLAPLCESMTHRLTAVRAVTCDHKTTTLPKVILGRGPRRGGLQLAACVAMRVGQWTVASIHEYACYAGNVAAIGRSFRRTIVTFLLISHKPQCYLETEYIAKSPQIELSNDTFAEQKRREVVTYESETFHCRRPNGISHCENGEQKTPKPPLPLARCGPHLTQQCLGPPHAPPQTAAPTVEALSNTDAVKSPLVTMARPKCAPKVPLPVDQSPNPTTSLIP